MTVTELIQEINDALRGLENEPNSGSDEYAYWLRVANRKTESWARDRKQRWASMWKIETAGTVSAGTQSYDMDDTFLWPSDQIIVTVSDQDHEFKVEKPQHRKRGGVYFSGRDPVTLSFADTIKTNSQIVGGTIYAPGYYMPEPLVNGSDLVTVDDPNWLVKAVAAEVAFNDVTYEDKYFDLNTEANALYLQMIEANKLGTASNPPSVAIELQKIRGVNRR